MFVRVHILKFNCVILTYLGGDIETSLIISHCRLWTMHVAVRQQGRGGGIGRQTDEGRGRGWGVAGDV